MDFPLTAPTSSVTTASPQQTNNTISQVSVGNNALQNNPATTVNVSAQPGATGGDRRQDQLGAQLEQAVGVQETLKDLQLTNRRTQINFNAELNKVFLQVVDTKTDEVIETIPPEELVRQLKEQVAPPDPDEVATNGAGPVDASV
jgi:uncharacterized FlaG/YvyC family protein